MEKRLELLVNTVPAALPDSATPPMDAASQRVAVVGAASGAGNHAIAHVEPLPESTIKHAPITQTVGWETGEDLANPEHPDSPYYPHGIKDRFVVRREIACGGMGSIYEVYDHVLHRR